MERRGRAVVHMASFVLTIYLLNIGWHCSKDEMEEMMLGFLQKHRSFSRRREGDGPKDSFREDELLQFL